MDKRIVRIGSRESKLAVWQAEYVASEIEKNHPEIQVEIITMKTTGDKILDRNLDQVGGKGLFVKELDQALLDHRTDISVHSLKDMPMEVPQELPILAFSKREDPRDVLIFREGIEKDPKVIGTSSRRRQVQLEKIYPNATFCGIRGNVQTRLRKLEEGLCDATVLAYAGLKRLGLEQHAGRIMETYEIIPAAGQGILAIQGRAGEDYSYLDCIADSEGSLQAITERAFVTELNGGCSSPIAAHAVIDGEEIFLSGLYYNEEKQCYVTGELRGMKNSAKELGVNLARDLKLRLG